MNSLPRINREENQKGDISPEAKSIMYGIFDELMAASQDRDNHPAFARMREEFKQEAERQKQK